MKTYNIRYRSKDKLKDFLQERGIPNSDKLLVQIFASPKYLNKITDIVSFLKQQLPSSHIVGATTDGEILEGRVLQGNIVLSFTLFEKTRISSKLFAFTKESKVMASQIETLLEMDTKALILLAAFKESDAQALIKSLHKANPHIIVSGALAGDDGAFLGGRVFCNTTLSQNGVVAIALHSKELIASNAYTSQWEPVGREFTVTKATKNRLISVDGMSVKALYSRYLGESVARRLPLSGLEFPFVLKAKEGYIARSILADPQDGSLVFGAKMKKGEKIQIGFGDMERMIDNSHMLLENINQSVAIETLFIYGASGRRRFLKQQVHYEIEPFGQVGSSCGFYGYGEFYANEKEALFLNQSLNILTLSESKEVLPKTLRFKKNYHHLPEHETLRALSNIAKVSSMELQELNQKLEERIKEEVAKNRKKDGILIHNSRLAQMGEMMSLIAHQWRQPLSAISATSTGLQVKIELGKYDESFFLGSLEKIEAYVKHLSGTIDDFTNFFKPSKKREYTTNARLIKKALFIMSASLQKYNIEIEVEDSAKSSYETYPNEIVQVLINLIKNAENVLRKREIQNPKIKIYSYEENKKQVIVVEDNGGGIESSIMAKIFEPYFTTKNNEASTGLGLYMSKFIIEESCGGRLEVSNQKDGARFKIIL